MGSGYNKITLKCYEYCRAENGIIMANLQPHTSDKTHPLGVSFYGPLSEKCYACLLYCVCTAVFTLDAGLLARSQHSEGPATGHLDTGFSWFPCA